MSYSMNLCLLLPLLLSAKTPRGVAIFRERLR